MDMVIVCIWKCCPCSSPQPEVEEIDVFFSHNNCYIRVLRSISQQKLLYMHKQSSDSLHCSWYSRIKPYVNSTIYLICCTADFYYHHPVLVYTNSYCWWLVYVITWIRVQFGNNCTNNGQSNCTSDSEYNLCLFWVQLFPNGRLAW